MMIKDADILRAFNIYQLWFNADVARKKRSHFAMNSVRPSKNSLEYQELKEKEKNKKSK